MTANLSVDLCGIGLKNPVLVASGTFGYGEEYAEYFDLNRLGGLVTKSISLYPRPGNPPPRIVETPAGMLNAIGLANVGADAFIREKLPFLRTFDVPVIANIACSTVEEYAEVAGLLSACGGIAGIEVNISCPNVKKEGMVFGTDPAMAGQVVAAVRRATSLPLIAKLTPNVTDIVEIAGRVVDAGADAVSLINTLLGMAVDVRCRKPKLANVTGGLSGPAIRPVALAMVWKVARHVSCPVIGIGGIMTAQDALEFFIAGATAVQVGTGNFIDPQISLNIIDGLQMFLEEEKIQSLTDIIGSLTIESRA